MAIPKFPQLWGERGAPFRSTPRSAPPPEPAPPSDHAPRLRPRPQGWPHLKPLPTSQPQLTARALLTHLDAVSAADVLASLAPLPQPTPPSWRVGQTPEGGRRLHSRSAASLLPGGPRQTTSADWAVVERLPTARVLWLEILTLPRTGFCVLFWLFWNFPAAARQLSRARTYSQCTLGLGQRPCTPAASRENSDESRARRAGRGPRLGRKSVRWGGHRRGVLPRLPICSWALSSCRRLHVDRRKDLEGKNPGCFNRSLLSYFKLLFKMQRIFKRKTESLSGM